MAREHFGIAVLDSLIYVVAGRQTGLGGISVTTFEAYNPARNEWKVLPSLPTARSGLGFAAAKGRLYAMGGEWPGTFDANEEYNPVTNSWRTVAKMPAAVHGFSAVTYQDTVFSLGTVNPSAAYLPSQATSILVAPNTATKTRPPSLMSSSWLGIFNGRIFNGLGIERKK
jgi:N-acetylneuraminic acid mutarotase